MPRGRSDVTNTDDDSAVVPVRDSLENMLADSVDVSRVEVPGGSRIADRFIVLRALDGNEVYLARDREVERDVVIELYRDLEDVERLHRDALALSRLAHPGIVSVLDVGEHGDRTFVAYELVEGPTLRSWVTASHRSRREILSVLLSAGEGLVAAHGAGVVHRDVTPENILVGADGRGRVTRFGFTRRRAAERPSTQDLTFDSSSVMVAAPLAYLAPEQGTGQRVGPAADQYAFAVVAWEALFGARPDAKAPRAPTDVGTKAPPHARGRARLRPLLRRALANEPANRFPNLRALLAALRRADRIRRGLFVGLAIVIALAAAAGLAWRAHQLDGDRAGARP